MVELSRYNQDTEQDTIRIQLGYNQDTSIGQFSEINQKSFRIQSEYRRDAVRIQVGVGIRLYPDALAEFERTKEAPFDFLEVFWALATLLELLDLGVCECHL